MNDVVIRPEYELPATIEDLSRFVLVGREKLISVRAEIRAIEKIGLAKEVREQKLKEAQFISEAMLDAEVRIGQLMQSVPKSSGGDRKSKKIKNDSGVDFDFELRDSGVAKLAGQPDSVVVLDKSSTIPPTPTQQEHKAANVPADSNSKQSQVPTASVKDATVKTKAEVIRYAGFTPKQVERFQQLAEHPELVEQAKTEARDNDDIVSRSLVLNKIKEQKRAEKEAKREEARQQNAEKVQAISNPLDAQGLFQTIVIDPAWDYSEEGDNDAFGRIRPSYHTMPMQEIEALPIAKLADDNCHLYLWVTNRTLYKAFHLIEAWGFRYITCLTWIKPHYGVGNYYRSQTEHVLFGVKGSQPLKRHDVGTWFEAASGQHSAKPDKFYELVESCSYAPYIDIFGRKERNGWTVWGENA